MEDNYKADVEELKNAHNRLTVVLRERQKRRRLHLASVEEFKDLVAIQKCGAKSKRIQRPRMHHSLVADKIVSLDYKNMDKTDKSQKKTLDNFEFKVPYPKKNSMSNVLDGKQHEYHNLYQDGEKTIRNDYCQHFVDSGRRPQNFIRDTELSQRFDEYPKLKELTRMKNALVENRATPPTYLKADLRTFDLKSLGTKFDVILIDPPLQELVLFQVIINIISFELWIHMIIIIR
jgi:hypothetical protein